MKKKAQIQISPLSWYNLKNGFSVDFIENGKFEKATIKKVDWKDLKSGILVKVNSKPTRLFTSESFSWKDLVKGKLLDVVYYEETTQNNLYRQTITIYNDIEKTLVEERHFDRFVIGNCNIQGGMVNKSDGTISNIVNAITVIIKDLKNYVSPLKYKKMPVDVRESYYTVQIGDFVVFDEVCDVVTTSAEFQKLQNKYRDKGMKITSISAFENGFETDNISITNA